MKTGEHTPQDPKQKGARIRELEQQEWYHGYRPSKDVNPLLKDVGDFLVRATDNGNKPLIVISVRATAQKVVHLTLVFHKEKWQLGVVIKKVNPPRFTYVVDLVEYYKAHRLPGRVILKKPISRPKWHIKHDTVIFDRKKDLLGSGNFCHVYKGVYRKDDEDLPVAVKIWHAGASSDKNAEESNDARDSMLSEAQLMSYYAHKHVIQLFGVACDHPPVMIVMEYCPGGNLEKHLKTHGEKIETGERIIYSLEAARGMRYLHLKNCVHRDLAARNCLISEAGRIKISDFGLSQLIGDEKEKQNVGEEDGKEEPGRGPQIPVRWMAPESLRRPMVFSSKSDVWSYGVLLYEIFSCGEKPWPDDPPKKIATQIRRGKMPQMPARTPPDLLEFMKQIWTIEADKRPTMKTIVGKMHDLSRLHRGPSNSHMTVNLIPGVNRGQVTLDDTMEAEEEDPPDVNYQALGQIMENNTKDTHTTESNLKTDQKTEQKDQKDQKGENVIVEVKTQPTEAKESKATLENKSKKKEQRTDKKEDRKEDKKEDKKEEKKDRTKETKDEETPKGGLSKEQATFDNEKNLSKEHGSKEQAKEVAMERKKKSGVNKKAAKPSMRLKKNKAA